MTRKKAACPERDEEQLEMLEQSMTPQSKAKLRPSTHPLDLTFYRQSVQRFILSNNIPLARLEPAQVVDIDLMHPFIGDATLPCTYDVRNGSLEISSSNTPAVSGRYVGGVNPYAVYEVDIEAIAIDSDHRAQAEVILDFAHSASSTSLQVVLIYPAKSDSLRLRYVKQGHRTHEEVLYGGPSIQAPYKFQVQLVGNTLNAFYTKDRCTNYFGRVQPGNNFASFLDLRHRATSLATQFCLRTHLPPQSTVRVTSVSSYLSAGVGQADIRLITYADGAPFLSPTNSADGNRLWFTFTVRGLGTGDGAQGVLSLDPSSGVAGARFEGLIVLDHGDGLFRNSYACHLFYHEEHQVWRAWFSDFGGAKGREGRGTSGLLVAESSWDPRKGFSVMKAKELKGGISGHHEDPCGVWDADAKRWRLLTTELSGSMRARMWESQHWDGPWTLVGQRAHRNCTGTLIQRVGKERFVFSGSSEGAVFVFRYPDLKELGTLDIDLPPFSRGKNSRVWPNVVPLPSGYPARYMALMMDRSNFPGITGPTWSYGAMYLYWAHTEEISGEEYEF